MSCRADRVRRLGSYEKLALWETPTPGICGVRNLISIASCSWLVLNIWVYRLTQIKDRRMNHPIFLVRRTDVEKHCRTVNQPSRLHRTVLTPNFNIEFSSLARQSFVHCTCSASITSIQLRGYVENLISTAVLWMYSVVKARYIGAGPRPED